METLVIQDVFDPYYVGRDTVARRVRAVPIRRPAEAGHGEKSPFDPADTVPASNRPSAEPREH